MQHKVFKHFETQLNINVQSVVLLFCEPNQRNNREDGDRKRVIHPCGADVFDEEYAQEK